ncbi:MAG: YfiR/HmsC family protein [Fidelibacterota bacterium]
MSSITAGFQSIRQTGLLLLLFLLPNPGRSQEMPLPVPLQYQLFLKILSFDKNLTARSADTLHMAVVYQSLLRSSAKTARAFLAETASGEQPQVKNLPLSIRCYDLKTLPELRAFLVRGRIDLVYIAPLRAVAVSDMTALTRELNILSLSGVTEYQRSGVAVNLNVRGETPEILIHQKNAGEEGADFSSRLLHLVTIIN